MKKIIFVLVMLFVCTISQAQNKWEWFETKNIYTATWSFGISSYYDVAYPKKGGYDISFSIMGVYLSLGDADADGRHSTNVGTWGATSCGHFHIGYTIPISKYFSITPMVGRVNSKSGVVNGNDWYVGNHGITNKYTANDRKYYTDYGTLLNINIYCQKEIALTLGVKLTQHLYSFNFGMLFNFSGLRRNR